ncbi:hypothetical protein I316_03486 [Kwoniella heveanensis BCC8398]|uniref:Uncharacterized protein n=1 Tax=Kwoniella heveanensis BCC8398 TaxID=1296120 RepID=A0A1B9GV73_9TREE|nr:hypothetical protein I316_03486 [Kwoniella heveanensis BCC8398]
MPSEADSITRAGTSATSGVTLRPARHRSSDDSSHVDRRASFTATCRSVAQEYSKSAQESTQSESVDPSFGQSGHTSQGVTTSAAGGDATEAAAADSSTNHECTCTEEEKAVRAARLVQPQTRSTQAGSSVAAAPSSYSPEPRRANTTGNTGDQEAPSDAGSDVEERHWNLSIHSMKL